jgi:hypothetical protein
MVDYHNILSANFNLGQFYGKLGGIPTPASGQENLGASSVHGRIYGRLRSNDGLKSAQLSGSIAGQAFAGHCCRSMDAPAMGCTKGP